MTKSDTFEVVSLAVRLAQTSHGLKFPQSPAQDAMELVRIAGQLHRLDEAACNEPETPAQARRSDKLAARAQEIAIRYGFQCARQGDPRGVPFYLTTSARPDYYNDVAATTIGVSA